MIAAGEITPILPSSSEKMPDNLTKYFLDHLLNYMVSEVTHMHRHRYTDTFTYTFTDMRILTESHTQTQGHTHMLSPQKRISNKIKVKVESISIKCLRKYILSTKVLSICKYSIVQQCILDLRILFFVANAWNTS